MKRFLAIALISTVGLIYSAGGASAAWTGTMLEGSAANKVSGYADGLSANGIVASRHNLGVFGMHTISGWDEDGGEETMITGTPTAGTSEICVFCHTPHHTVPSRGPLWNRGGPTSYTTYVATIGDSNTGGLGPNSYANNSASSLACLSCHDGETNFDLLVNAPGMGLTDTEGDADAVWATGSDMGWTFREKAGSTFGAEHRLSIGADTAGLTSGDLSNDHPIGMPYREGEVASLRDKTTLISGINLALGLMNKEKLGGMVMASAFDGSNLAQNKWAVYGFINTDATIADLLKGTPGETATVECASCHDPHFNNKSWGENSGSTNDLYADAEHDNGLFLRRVGGNAGSGVCRTCHDK